MNGVCCVWQMQEEEDRREALRKDIRIEYERQRLIDRQQRQMDMERWSDESNEARQRESDASRRDDRRRSLLHNKMDLSRQIRRESGQQERESASESGASIASTEAVLMPVMKEARKHLLPPREMKRLAFASRRLDQLKAATKSTADMNSLFEFGDDDSDGDGDSFCSLEAPPSLVDVALD